MSDRHGAGSPRLPFLFEVGSDDLPARFLPIAVRHCEAALADLLAELGLDHGGIRVLATPRRMAFLVDDLAAGQADRQVELKGPPLSVAYDDAGEPTPAALGFARKSGVDLADCREITDAKGGRFLSATRHEPGRPAADLLAERLPALILGIPFPKTMRWGEGDVEYARPLQWLVALLGDAVVPVSLAGIAAGRMSRGHRTLADDGPVEIPAPGDYVDLMRRHGVIVDQGERRRMIEEGAADRLREEAGADWLADEELLGEVVDLCEHPTPFLGGYDESFFALPPEVIVTALKAHQRYFAVVGPDGGLLPRFLAVRDGGREHLDGVRRGNERVLRARLSDALFYWDFDQRQGPDAHVARLADVTWLEGFGSLGEKVSRLVELAPWLWERGLGEGKAPAELSRAAALCKFDLVTEMIRDGKEFTKLEGLIGARYAARAGESEAVCRAIETHYQPRAAGDEPPADILGATLSLADRFDTLAGCWLAGFAPTGAKDPYALRRHALACLRIVMEREARLDLESVLERACAPFAARAGAERLAAAVAELAAFCRRRLSGHLVENLGCDADAVRAVLPPHGNDPTDCLAWARALSRYRDLPDFQLLATGFKRCQNILEGHFLAGGDLDGSRDRWARGGETPEGEGFADLREPAEARLRDEVAASAPALAAAETAGDHAAVFATLSGLGPAIDAYFDSVRVNVDDPALKGRRHDFLREVHGLFIRYADISAVAPQEENG